VRVCTSLEQCGAGETCVRYRCVALAPARGRADTPARAIPGAQREATEATSATERPVAAPAAPAAPDTTAELRAIRRELERLQQGQERILEAIEKNRGAR